MDTAPETLTQSHVGVSSCTDDFSDVTRDTVAKSEEQPDV